MTDPIRFGGWSDYAEWAEHDFRDRKPNEEPTSTGQHAVVVEVMTAVVPITLPEEPADDDYVSRTSCRIVSPDGHDDVEGIDFLLEVDDQMALVRPYLGSDAQAGTRNDLAFETVIETTRPYSTLPIATLGEDQRMVCRTCVTPQSVAEIAVSIGAPIGLTQMLIGEGIDRGFLRVHSTVPVTKDGLPSIELLRRVHRGLSRLA
ncbi:DUF742 domain-containing protein [Amycolatopsis japonica]